MTLGRVFFMVRFSQSDSLLSPFDGKVAFYFVVSNAFAKQIANANLDGRRLAISVLVRKDPQREGAYIGHVFEITYYEDGHRKVLQSK